MRITPADRLKLVSEYYFSRKLKEVAKMNADGMDVISLAIGSPDMPPSKETVDTLCENAHKPDAHGYQPTVGIPELRNAMAAFYKRWYGVELDPAKEIQPLIGSKEGILHVTLALVNPGEKVLVPNPGYPTYTSLSKILGCEIVNYDLLEDKGWQPDFDQLEAMDLSGVKIMWTNYPNMPTGGRATRELYEKIVNFARRHNIVVVNDNPYSFILNDSPLSILAQPGAMDCCLELNSLSKAHNMAGWRIGMVAAAPDVISEILKVKSQMDSGMFKPLQLAAVKALGQGPEWFTELNDEYRRRRVLAGEIFDMLGVTYDHSSAGMFLWGRVPQNIQDDNGISAGQVLSDRILYEAGVFITPGFIFGKNGEEYVRISLCATPETLRKAAERIRSLTD